jgi:copper chaperone CopZ
MKLFLLALLLAAAAFAADETVTHRVTGLFSPDRETDLRAVLEQLPEIKLVSLDFEHAEATFTYDPAVAFKSAKPEEIVKRFDEKLRAVSNSTFGIQPLCPTPKDQLTRVEIPVVGLDCKACGLAAYEAIFKIDGVAQATASFKEGRVTALIDPAKTNRAALDAALEKKQVKLKAP